MPINLTPLYNPKRVTLKSKEAVSLSKYFPRDTVYFYGYPSGDESGFLNKVPPRVEELVSGRPLACAGNNVKIVTFAPVINNKRYVLNSRFQPPALPISQLLVLPKSINDELEGSMRNDQVKKSLLHNIKPGTLIMAQPFMDKELYDLFQISPKLTNWLNDKNNMVSYAPQRFLAKRHKVFKNGSVFALSTFKLPIPCVIKVSSSSAGDGVYICHSAEKIKSVRADLSAVTGTIIVEEYVNAVSNYGVQFGVPEDPELPIDIIGIDEQLTTPDGEFIGGIIKQGATYPELNEIRQALVSSILPEIRKMGWYGVGCFDILVDKNGKCYIVDGNFRMTGMTAYLMLVANKKITKSLVSFNGEFSGSLTEMKKLFSSISVSSRNIHILTLVDRQTTCGVNAALLFDAYEEVPLLAQSLLNGGMRSTGLSQLANLA